jgi:hypothetical protein
LKIPLDTQLTQVEDIPHTISYVIRKRQQIDGLNELPKEKRPPELTIWDGSPEELDKWIDDVFDNKKQRVTDIMIEKVEE